MTSRHLNRFQLLLTSLTATLLLAGCNGIGGRGIIGSIILILDIIAIIEIAGSSRGLVSKVLWILLVLAFPVGGVIIYFVVGR
jgi:hypothetical protein